MCAQNRVGYVCVRLMSVVLVFGDISVFHGVLLGCVDFVPLRCGVGMMGWPPRA